MKTLMLATSMILAVSSAHAGMKTVCTHDSQTRVIEVVYSGPEVVPCEVRYTKEEGTQVLWSAQNATGYCEEKAEAFVEKQRGWGWNCETTMADAADTATEDMTTDEMPAAPSDTMEPAEAEPAGTM